MTGVSAATSSSSTASSCFVTSVGEARLLFVLDTDFFGVAVRTGVEAEAKEELATLFVFPPGSATDFDLSLPDFCKNLGNFELWIVVVGEAGCSKLRFLLLDMVGRVVVAVTITLNVLSWNLVISTNKDTDKHTSNLPTI
jgi:hypothetical protein